MTVLKPCPFCGGDRARTIHIRDGRKVACICGACGKPEFHGPLDRPDAETRAITAWNTRIDEPTPSQTVSQDRAVEAVARALAECDGITPNDGATYALSTYGPRARAAIAAFKKSEVGHE